MKNIDRYTPETISFGIVFALLFLTNMYQMSNFGIYGIDRRIGAGVGALGFAFIADGTTARDMRAA